MSILMICEGAIFYSSRPISVLADGLNGISAFGKGNKNMPGVINKECGDGLTLISAASNDPLMFASGISMKNFIQEGSGKYWYKALAAPQSLVKCVVFSKADDIYDKLAGTSKLLKNYTNVYKSQDAWVYKKNNY